MPPFEDDDDAAEQQARKKKKRQVVMCRDVVIKRLIKRDGKPKPSPVVQLQEIFEEAPDKGRFVGDTMFWKFFPDIAINRIYHTDSVEYRNLWVMFWETVFFIVLLIFFMAYVYLLQSRSVYGVTQEQELYWSGCNSTGHCKLDQVNNERSFWEFMHGDFVNRAFTEYADPPPDVASILTVFPANDFPITWHPRFVGPSRSSVLLGTIRLRQLRVKKNTGCTVSKLFAHIYPDCYAEYSDVAKSVRPYASRFVPTYIREAFGYMTEEETMQASMSGTYSSYGGDGFVVDLPWNSSDSKTLISDLWQWKWVDQGTRAVVVELSTLHTNVNVICNTRLLFEFGPTGSVAGKVQSLGGRVELFMPSTSTSSALTLLVLMIVVFILFVFFGCYSGWLMFKTCKNFIGENPWRYLRRQSWAGKLMLFPNTLHHYLRYLWNLCDLTMITLFFTHIGFRFGTFSAVSGVKVLAPSVIGHPEMFMPFSGIMRPLVYSRNVLSVLAILMWIKLFKYLTMSSYFRLLVSILERCAAKLFVFSVIIVVVFFGFAVAFFAGWSSTEEKYLSIFGSFLVNFFLLLDGFEVSEEWFAPGRDGIMPAVFLIFIAMIYFVLMFIAVAIVLDTHATIDRSAKEDPDRKNPMIVFIYTYYKMMLGVSLVQVEAEENMKQDELSIPLELLPGVVRRKFIEKKRKMQRIANESFAGMEIYPLEYDDDAKAASSSDWMLPNSRQDVFSNLDGAAVKGPLALYDVPEGLLRSDISRAQLQRLMDDDPSLPILLHESRAEKVIRRFKNLDARAAAEGQEDVGAIKKLQGQVFGKIDGLEQVKFGDEIEEVREITELTEEMNSAVTGVRNQFRIELTGIIEATALLFEHLVEVTQGLDAVRENHEAVLDSVRDKAESELMANHKRGLFGR